MKIQGELILAVICIFLLLAASPVLAGQMRYQNTDTFLTQLQGRVTLINPLTFEEDSIPDGMYDMTFIIYDEETGGTQLWEEDRLGEQGVVIKDNGFNINLGEVEPLPADEFSFTEDYWVEICMGEQIFSSRVKLKFRRDWGIKMLSAVRNAFPNETIHIDCNGAYTLNDLPMFKELDPYNLAMIEQPLMHDDLIDHATLQKRIATPICLDESITSPEKARKAVEIGACRWVNIKPARVGGLANALEINRICQDAGVGCWVGGMLESGLGTAFCIALATLPNMKYPSGIVPSDRFYAENISVPPIALSGPSRITPPSTPGAGAEPDPERLAKSTVESDCLRA